MIWLAIAWLMLWSVHACEVEKLLKAILAEMKKRKDD